MFDNNYKVKTENDGKLFLNPDTFMPGQILNIKLSVYGDAQHDGHCWDESFIDECKSQLVANIMDKLKEQVEDFVTKIDPFSIHRE